MQTVDGEDLLLSFLFWQQTGGVSYDLVCSQVKNVKKCQLGNIIQVG